MNLKTIIRKQVFKIIKEGISEEGTPDLKYYAFDWDDNILFMPTTIIVLDDNDEEVKMSTEDFAEYRGEIGKENFEYKGRTIVGYANNPYRNFTVEGDKNFLTDCMMAKTGPSWSDFVECVNGGSVFAIITARGHSPEVMKEAVYNLIISNHDGIDSKRCVENLKKYIELLMDQDASELSDKDVIDDYLELCYFAPVTNPGFGGGSASNPEEGKIMALRSFISYCKELSNEIGVRGLFKNDMLNKEPKIGFSDDDPRNIEKISGFLEKEYPEKPVDIYLTKGGEKKKVN